MPRELILVTRSAERLTGATRIEPGYPRDYTADDMRMWADDMGRLNRVSPAELRDLRASRPDQLSSEQQRMLAVHDRCMTNAQDGIKGSLGRDGRIELDGGRHRAAYMIERGVDPVPVWVWAPEQRQLDDLRARCEGERVQVREPGRERNRDADSGGDRVRS
ncbi:MAG: hypothetical protein QOJ63_2812 [Solirubrobacteraceae bacterium]|jgi:hypothetical protein|nr:hypothetical protein [Solirubrobacteraceae bacterium]